MHVGQECGQKWYRRRSWYGIQCRRFDGGFAIGPIMFIRGRRETEKPEPLTPKQFQIPGRGDRRFYNQVRWEDEYGWSWRHKECTIEEAEVVSSRLFGTKMHAPVLDVDIRAYLIPSSTSGHSHLFLDHELSWRKYKKLLKALARAGVIEKGYMKASIRRGHTAVRVPWVTKKDQAQREGWTNVDVRE